MSTARANAQDALARATQAVQAVQQMQSVARNLAAAAGRSSLGANPNNPSLQLPSVPNGLGIGGLNPAAGATAGSSLWSGANLPTETTSKGQTVVTVDQTLPDAVLTWSSFSVGSATTLDFNQSKTGATAENSIVFNIIEDPTGVPSQILGSIEAAGQVYVINQNGIIFGAGSLINVHTLVASSLPINTNLISRGLLNNPDYQFLFSQLAIPAGSIGPTPAFNPPAPVNAEDGDVIVQAGAKITAPANADSTGGRVALIGPNVTNEGTISTPDGQTILAAGEQVGFAASADPTLRGLDTYIGAVNGSSGVATNDGLIEVDQGDAMIAGREVNQLGVIDSTTSVTLNGRVDLDASYGTAVTPGLNDAPQFSPTETGMVTLGAGSETDILPDLASSATVVGTQLALSSEVNIEGETIHFATNSQLLAPNASVSITAGGWVQTEGSPAQLIPNSGQIYLDAGASIDVAGSIVSAPVSQNIVSAELLGPELADSPLQRNGVLYGQTIEVDARDTGVYDGVEWEGTPLANVSGYIDLIRRPVGELTTAGGTVNLTAGGSVVMQPSSEINVSGGAINYQGGMVQTTDLLYDGRIINIANATPDLVYQGILGKFTVSSAKWGIEQTYITPLVGGPSYQDSYAEGGNGGSITIAAPAMALDGQLLGQTTTGPRQLATPPAPSSLTLSFLMQTGAESGTVVSPTPPAITFEYDAALPAVPGFAVDSSGNPIALPALNQHEVLLSPDLFTQDGFGSLTVTNEDGNIVVPANVAVNAPTFGSITLNAANLSIEGSITAPDGTLDFTVYYVSPYGATQSSNRGRFVLAAGATLSTAGLIVDNLEFSPTAYTEPEAMGGGSITIDSFSADLAAGSAIDVSGGVLGNPSGTLTYGNGGTISIKAGQDPDNPATLGGRLILDATLTGYSGAAGGTLSILAPGIQIGGGTSADPAALVLAPSFFDQGGFANFALTGLGSAVGGAPLTGDLPGVVITPGAVISAVAENWVGAIAPISGAGITLTPMLLPEAQRTPVSLSLSAPGVRDLQNDLVVRGDFVMGSGAIITTDAGGTVSISADTADVLGSIDAPGGKITIKGASDSDVIFDPSGTTPLITVYLGPDSILSTAGTTVLTPYDDFYGYPTGTVYPGGSISVSGNIAAAAGSVLNVSGASGVLYLRESETVPGAQGAGSFLGAPIAPFRVDSNGGTITLAGAEELFSDATLIGTPGGPAAVGGSLSISSGLFVPPGANAPPSTNIDLTVTQGGLPAPTRTGIGQSVLGSKGQVLSQTGGGSIAADDFLGGGFDNITLGGSVQFNGTVTIRAAGELSVGSGGVISTEGNVNLIAPYVVLGVPFAGPLTAAEETESPFATGQGTSIELAPTAGTGHLTVSAALIDIGTLSLQDIDQANFIANGGDIRGDGTLDVEGQINMTAGQIYPATDVIFTIAAYNDGGTPGTITIHAAGTRDLPLSAGGTLNLYASVINQDGVLAAPIGTINLGWNSTAGTAPIDPITGAPVNSTTTLTLGSQSITSVSAVNLSNGQALIIPYGSNPTGTEWIDPAGNKITTGGVPAKAINLAGTQIVDKVGSVVDLSGGGNLSSYEFVAGEGGSTDFLNPGETYVPGTTYSTGALVTYKGNTYVADQESINVTPGVNQYWSEVPTSYAVIPGYQASYAPYAPFNAAVGDPGYVSNNLPAGQQVYLGAGSGLTAGIYTLLPARYALLPGAYLVTPETGIPAAGQTEPDGSSIVSGYLFNGFSNPGGLTGSLISNFQVESQSVVLSHGQYTTFLANTFLAQEAAENKVAVPLLPIDAGQLNLNATSALVLQGIVNAQAPDGGAAGLVDINNSSNIEITAGPSAPAGSSGLVLNATELSSFGAANLLIGGYITSGAAGTSVTVDTNSITVEQGAQLTGGDVILVSNGGLTVDGGASIRAEGRSDDLALTLTGNGTLLRVSNDPTATITRTGVSAGGSGSLTADAKASLKGASVILDSSNAAHLDPAANFAAKEVTLDAGLISIVEPGATATPGGLVLSGNALQQIQTSAAALTLLSYSSIDLYGSAGAPSKISLGNLTLSAAQIRTFDQGAGGPVTLAVQNITVDGNLNATAPAPGGAANGTLVLNGGVIHLGGAALEIDSNLQLNGSGGIIGNGSGEAGTASALVVAGNLTMAAPLITGAAAAQTAITSDGAVSIAGAGSNTVKVSGGLAANLSITGQSIADDGNIAIPSGTISLITTNGNLVIGDAATTVLSVKGTEKSLLNAVRYTSGGTINLIAGSLSSSATPDAGNVMLGADGTIDVTAQTGGGSAGTLNISVPQGSVSLLGTLDGKGGANGQSGSFSLVAGSIPGVTYQGQSYGAGSVDAIDAILNAGGFSQSISISDRNDASVTLNDTVTAAVYNVSADQGSITILGTINAGDISSTDPSGNAISIGGSITLTAAGDVTIGSGADLNVSAQNFNNAGEGGSVTLSAGAGIVNGDASTVGSVDIQAGSTINLSVADSEKVAAEVEALHAGQTPAQIAADIENTNFGNDFAGTLLIQTPQATVGSDRVLGTIIGAAAAATSGGTPIAVPDAASIVVEGYDVYNVNAFSSTGVITSALQSQIYNDGVAFLGANGATTSNYTNLVTGLVGSNAALGTGGLVDQTTQGLTFNLETGAEIINPSGNLVLGSNTAYSASNDWDLENDRFGPNGTAGQLTLRASGNLLFYNTLSDGFLGAGNTALLMRQNPALPANIQSWSYTLTAGADLGAVAPEAVLPQRHLASGAGSLELGRNDAAPYSTNGGTGATTASVLNGYFQVIRTGAGNIDISTAANVELLNQFASIYTAGAQVLDPTMGGAFSIPYLDETHNFSGGLGAGTVTAAPGYAPQYSVAGGNVTIAAQGSIEHLTVQNGSLVMDSEDELPDNWLYRRGDVTSAGLFDSNSVINDPSESTTWWVDFSNFYEGVGALGGGNVTMTAGGDIANVDAVVPTNARMPGIDPTTDTNLAPNAASLVELGGGDLIVEAGDDINAGVYYVEKGQGTLSAGNQILTNSTRAPVGGKSPALGGITAPQESWLPTTLFAGDASFNISAGGSIVLGPAANPFLLPEGLENSIWYKTYFSTYGLNDSVNVTSLGGNITFDEYAITSDNQGGPEPILQVWLQNTDLLVGQTQSPNQSRAYYQPWLRINESSVNPFAVDAELMPGRLVATTFAGNINIVGDLLLSPSPTGTIDQAASGSIIGFQLLGQTTAGSNLDWEEAAIDVSDSDPAFIPGVATPIGYQEVPGIGTNVSTARATDLSVNFLAPITDLFAATNTGAPGTIETEQALHDSGILHAGDTNPVELYAAGGDITGVTLYSPTETQVVAGEDITDVSFYLQNAGADAISVISAGGDIVTYDPSSPARQPAQGSTNTIYGGTPAGDIQIAGPGTLEVLAGAELELGGQGPGGASNTTGDGIASIGNTQNPFLPFAGADIIAAAGIGGSTGIGQSDLDFSAFISQFIESPAGASYLGELRQITSSYPGITSAASFSALTTSQQDLLALDVFFLVLRDAGRDHNLGGSAGFGNYDAGLAAIAALFPEAGAQGNIDVTSRDIVTESGGNISLLAPNGEVTVGLNSTGGNDVTNLGIVTQDGGNISIFSSGDVNVGTSRIFTLRGGNEIIWSSEGNIDAGASSKTVQSAPPTRVLVDPQSANVQTDLAGLATGGGIGVLASVAGVPAGNVDLIAPTGAVNAGEAGIRATGNLNIAAVQVLNAGNISVGGASTGLPPPVAAPNIAGLTAASSAAGAAINSAPAVQSTPAPPQDQGGSPIVSVQVIGYGGSDDDDSTDSSNQSL